MSHAEYHCFTEEWSPREIEGIGSASSLREALFPKWKTVSKIGDSSYHKDATSDPEAICHMTEIQLQAILDSK